MGKGGEGREEREGKEGKRGRGEGREEKEQGLGMLFQGWKSWGWGTFSQGFWEHDSISAPHCSQTRTIPFVVNYLSIQG